MMWTVSSLASWAAALSLGPVARKSVLRLRYLTSMVRSPRTLTRECTLPSLLCVAARTDSVASNTSDQISTASNSAPPASGASSAKPRTAGTGACSAVQKTVEAACGWKAATAAGVAGSSCARKAPGAGRRMARNMRCSAASTRSVCGSAISCATGPASAPVSTSFPVCASTTLYPGRSPSMRITMTLGDTFRLWGSCHRRSTCGASATPKERLQTTWPSPLCSASSFPAAVSTTSSLRKPAESGVDSILSLPARRSSLSSAASSTAATPILRVRICLRRCCMGASPALPPSTPPYLGKSSAWLATTPASASSRAHTASRCCSSAAAVSLAATSMRQPVPPSLLVYVARKQASRPVAPPPAAARPQPWKRSTASECTVSPVAASTTDQRTPSASAPAKPTTSPPPSKLSGHAAEKPPTATSCSTLAPGFMAARVNTVSPPCWCWNSNADRGCCLARVIAPAPVVEGSASDTGWQLQVALGSSGAVQSCAPSALSTAMEDLSTARDAPASGPAASGTSMDDDDRTEPSRADTVAASSPTVSPDVTTATTVSEVDNGCR
mmetsp:Transcript_16246/g.41512  ORF Transcript_16246/g.41512 Transcript_16246/m.41512 type:complete len:557 (-) Transcript_16246:634-2304(-)